MREAIRVKAQSLGFSRARVTSADPAARLEQFKAWVQEGQHGDMQYVWLNPCTVVIKHAWSCV